MMFNFSDESYSILAISDSIKGISISSCNFSFFELELTIKDLRKLFNKPNESKHFPYVQMFVIPLIVAKVNNENI